MVRIRPPLQNVDSHQEDPGGSLCQLTKARYWPGIRHSHVFERDVIITFRHAECAPKGSETLMVGNRMRHVSYIVDVKDKQR